MTPGVDITLVIRKTEGKLTVSALPKAEGLKEKTCKSFVPLTLMGTPEELDAGFLSAMCQPMQKVCGIVSNVVEFEKQAEKAAAGSRNAAARPGSGKADKAPKGKETEAQKAAREKKEKFDQYMKKAGEQAAAQNYAEALTNFQHARLYAHETEYEKLDEKIGIMKMNISQGSLFDVPAAPSPAVRSAGPVSYPRQQPALQNVPSASAVSAAQQPVQPAAASVYGMPSAPMSGRVPQQACVPQQPVPGGVQPAQPSWGQAPQGFEPSPQTIHGPGYFPQTMSYAAPAGAEPLPTCRPEEYAGYPDFPETMLQQGNPVVNPQM